MVVSGCKSGCRRGGNAAGCSAIHLPHDAGCCSVRDLAFGDVRAGQGAHREVGSEGFAAKRRAVAEGGEPVGQVQAEASPHYGGEANTWNAWAQQGVCGRHGVKAARGTPGGLARSRPTGRVAGRISREGEVAGDAEMREVGVAHGTWEPETSRTFGTAPWRGGGRCAKSSRPWGRGHAGVSARRVLAWASRRRRTDGCCGNDRGVVVEEARKGTRQAGVGRKAWEHRRRTR